MVVAMQQQQLNGLELCRYAVSVRWEREQAERRRRENESSSGPVSTNQPLLTFSIEDFNRYFCCCARRVGSMFFLLEKKDGSPIVVAGPCWPFCTFVTVPLIVVLSVLVGAFIVSNPNTGLPWWFGLIYYPIVIFVLTALFCVSCRDPGLMERVTDEEAAENGWFWNEQVGSYRPQGAMYCRECKVSVKQGIAVSFLFRVASQRVICVPPRLRLWCTITTTYVRGLELQ